MRTITIAFTTMLLLSSMSALGQDSGDAAKCISLSFDEYRMAFLKNSCSRRVYVRFCWRNEKSDCRCESGKEPPCATSIGPGKANGVVGPGETGYVRVRISAKYE